MTLKGCFTAIITPFKGTSESAPIDWEAYKELIEFQDKNGIAGIAACGTTGESATLSHEEHIKVIEFTLEHSKGTVLAGTGSNCTWEAVELTQKAKDCGAEYSLQVCPYYNKPNQEGLFRHFSAIAEKCDLDIILYNVPSRTAKEIAPETTATLAKEHANIVGIKEAGGSKEAWKKLKELCPKDFVILSGNDGDTYELMKNYGAHGVVSVASNLIPREVSSFVELGLRGNFGEMEKENAKLSEIFKAIFVDTNPIPVKELMNLAGLNAGGFRLPLCEASKENRAYLREVLNRLETKSFEKVIGKK